MIPSLLSVGNNFRHITGSQTMMNSVIMRHELRHQRSNNHSDKTGEKTGQLWRQQRIFRCKHQRGNPDDQPHENSGQSPLIARVLPENSKYKRNEGAYKRHLIRIFHHMKDARLGIDGIKRNEESENHRDPTHRLQQLLIRNIWAHGT